MSGWRRMHTIMVAAALLATVALPAAGNDAHAIAP